MPSPSAPFPRDMGFQPVPNHAPIRRPIHSRIFTTIRSSAYLLFSLSTLLYLTGCRTPPPTPATLKFVPNPQLRPITEVIAAIDANNQKIPTLWATLNYSVTIFDKGHSHSLFSDDGILLFSRPNFVHLVGKKELVGTVFDLGSNAQEFWLEVVPGVNTMYWDTYANLARNGGATLNIPIRPDLIAEVLGVGTFNENLLQPPVPIMRYDGSTDSYVFLFASQGDYKWFPQKEVWYDRATLRPRRLMIYDYEGVPQLDARLSADKPVQVPDVPQAQWPIIAGDFKLFFPASGNHMEFTLKDVRLYRTMRNTRIPNPSSFDRPNATDVRQEKVTGSNGE